jgi:hypothetical protein
MAIELGSTVKDKITGFQGIAIGRTVWLNGCVRIGIQRAQIGKDGKIEESQWLDEDQLIVIDRKYLMCKKETGGPMPDPTLNLIPH